MARTGRPIIKRSPKALARDIATLRRLRSSLLRDNSLDASAIRSTIELLDKTISELQALSYRICA